MFVRLFQTAEIPCRSIFMLVFCSFSYDLFVCMFLDILQKWFHMFIPKRLEVDVLCSASSSSAGRPPTSAAEGKSSEPEKSAVVNTLDISKLHIRARDRRSVCLCTLLQ